MRYRAQNSIGFSDWSEIEYIIVSGKPNKPQKPFFISSTSTSIELGIFYLEDDNGA